MWLEGWTALSANNHLVVPVAIQETDLISQISMFPNPVSSAALISLNLENSASFTISIVDMQGRGQPDRNRSVLCSRTAYCNSKY